MNKSQAFLRKIFINILAMQQAGEDDFIFEHFNTYSIIIYADSVIVFVTLHFLYLIVFLQAVGLFAFINDGFDIG